MEGGREEREIRGFADLREQSLLGLSAVGSDSAFVFQFILAGTPIQTSHHFQELLRRKLSSRVNL